MDPKTGVRTITFESTADAKPKIVDQLMNYAKGHYENTPNVTKDLQKIFGACGLSTNTTYIVEELANLTHIYILGFEDPMEMYRRQMVFLFRTFKKNFDELALCEIDELEKIVDGVWNSIIKSALESMIVVLAQVLDEEEIQPPMSRIMPVRTPPIHKEKKK